MANFKHPLGRKMIYFTDHALDRWWDRCQRNKVSGRKEAKWLLDKVLDEATWSRSLPAWCGLSIWNLARAEGFIYVDENSGFVVNRNVVGGDHVAVTYIERSERQAA